MARLLSQHNVEGINSKTNFVNPRIDTESLVRASTSGNKIMDMVFDKAISLANNINEVKRQNKLAELQIEAQKNIDDYELQWKSVDRYSQENYDEYLKGLNQVYEKNKNLIAGTDYYINESDVNSWRNKIDSEAGVELYRQSGLKAQYEIKKAADETTLNIEATKSNYIQTGDENLKETMIKLYDSLKSLGVPEHEIELMKIKSLIDSDSSRIQVEADSILNNPDLTLEQKMEMIKTLNINLNNKQLMEEDVNEAVKKGYISNDMADVYKKYSDTVRLNKWNSSNGILSKLEEQIRNENYRIQTQTENERLKIENKILKEKADVKTNIKNGNNLNAISIIEGRPVDPTEMITTPGLSEKYYGYAPNDILKKNEYIQTASTYEINNIKNQARIDKINNVQRSQTVGGIFERIDNIQDYNLKENIKREYISNGVINGFELHLYENQSSSAIQYTEMIDYLDIGGSNGTLNKMGGFVGIADANIREALQPLGNDFNKRELVSQIIVGGILSGRFGTAIDTTKGITATTFRQTYKLNKDFKDFVDDTIKAVSTYEPIKYKKADIKYDNYDRIIDKKYENETITIRRQSMEKGLTPYEETFTTYENF